MYSNKRRTIQQFVFVFLLIPFVGISQKATLKKLDKYFQTSLAAWNIPGMSIDGFYSIKELYDSWNFWIIFTAGFTPIPFKLFTISAGAFGVDFAMFVIASVISHSARFFLVAGLIKMFGEPIREFIDKYFNILAILFTILLIGGFLIIKMFI